MIDINDTDKRPRSSKGGVVSISADTQTEGCPVLLMSFKGRPIAAEDLQVMNALHAASISGTIPPALIQSASDRGISFCIKQTVVPVTRSKDLYLED